MKLKIIAEPDSMNGMPAEDRVREALAYTEMVRDLYDKKVNGYHMYSREAFLNFVEKVQDILEDRVY